MDIFEPSNNRNFVCPICGTSDKKLQVWVPIANSIKNSLQKGQWIHIDCLDLVLSADPDSLSKGSLFHLCQVFASKGEKK